MERLDKILTQMYPEFSRSRLEGLVKAGFVKVDGAVATKAGMKVSEGAAIEVEIPPPVPAVPEPEDIALSIVYEDEELIVVDKPAGMVVHPAPGHFSGTLVNALLAHCPNLSGIGGVARPGIVHRLDRDTSGLIAVAKTERAMAELAKAFASHKFVAKTYLAICHSREGLCSGRIVNEIARHPVDRKRMAIVQKGGKQAITNWRVVGRLEQGLSLVECKIETGRTHQIRVHMASLGMPIAGDATYGKSARDKALSPFPERQMLHAWKLELYHPGGKGLLSFASPVPDDMLAYFNDEARQAVTTV